MSDQAINWLKAEENRQLEIINAELLESLKHTKKFAKIYNLNNYLAAKVKDLEAAEPIQDLNKELAAAYHKIDKLEEELQIEKQRSAKLERQFEKYKSELETTDYTNIVQLQLEKDILLY